MVTVETVEDFALLMVVQIVDVIAKNAPIIMGEDTKVKRSIRNINASSIDTIKIFQ